MKMHFQFLICIALLTVLNVRHVIGDDDDLPIPRIVIMGQTGAGKVTIIENDSNSTSSDEFSKIR